MNHNWSTYTPGTPILITKQWYLNGRCFVEGGEGHTTVLVEVDSGNPEEVTLPEDCYSFMLYCVAQTEVTIKGAEETLLLKSEPLHHSPACYVRELVKFYSKEGLRQNFKEEHVGPLVERMSIMEVETCMVLPGKIMMPVTDEVFLVEQQKSD